MYRNRSTGRLTYRRVWSLLYKQQPAGYVVPFITGCVMICASTLPWLRDPLGEVYTAWKLPVDLGWQFHTAFLNYGILCVGSASYTFSVAYANWKYGIAYSHIKAGIICLLPTILFLLQYLYTDLSAIAVLAQHKNQMLLLVKHFGYSTGSNLFPLKAFTIDISNVLGRFQLLVDQMQLGVLITLPGFWLLLNLKRSHHPIAVKKQSKYRWLAGGLLLLFLVIAGKAVGGDWCVKQAGDAINQGKYSDALQWLDTATYFNPSFKQVLFFHIERGQALYMMNPNQQTIDSQVYIASSLINQYDYQKAYQQMLPVWQTKTIASWMTEELRSTLESMVESTSAAQIQHLPRTSEFIVKRDDTALPWLRSLLEVEPGNVYGQYMLGRIEYDLQEYALSKAQFAIVLHMGTDTNLQSSILTYMALSDAGMGNYIGERQLLLQAVQFDPDYRNNTAREELSGLH